MKIIISSLLICFSICSVGQEIEKVKNKISKDNYEIFYVLKSDNSIKHGHYELYENKELKLSGYYKSNVKDSIWTFYYSAPLSKKISAKGLYSNNKRIKLWEFYNHEGKLAQTFDFNTYTLNNLVDSIEEKKQNLIMNGKYKGLIYVDKNASYKNGNDNIIQFIGKNLKYPNSAKSNGIQGRVFTSFIVNEKGELSDFEIFRPAHEILNDEALRVLKLSEGQWTPATFENEPVSTRQIIPLSFTLR